MPFSAWSFVQILFGACLASSGFFALYLYRSHRRSRVEEDLAQTLRDIQLRQRRIEPQTVSTPASPRISTAFRKDRGLRFPSFEGTVVPEQSTSPEVPPTLISIPSLDAQPIEDSDEVDFDLGKRWSVVWNLAEEGHDLESISKATGLLIGEVELILGLMRSIQNAAKRNPKMPKDSHS